jgi:hypothetical protein
MSLRLLAPAAVGFCLLASFACSSKATAGGQGASCNVVSDCQDGLVCVPQKNGSSICSSDLSGVQQLPPTPDSGAMQAATDGGGGAGGDAAGSTGGQDSGGGSAQDSGGGAGSTDAATD